MNLDEIEKLSKEIPKNICFQGSIGKFFVQETLLELCSRIRKLEYVVRKAKIAVKDSDLQCEDSSGALFRLEKAIDELGK